jgi:hypothetical protein
MPDIELRPVTPEDDAFVLAVFIDSHLEYEYLPLPPDQKRQLIEMQYRLQTADYTARFPGSRHDVILRDGAPSGRIWVARLEDQILIVDIGMRAAAQNGGIGSTVVRRLQDEARDSGKPLRSSVFRFNDGSLRWHQRLGFIVESEDEMQYHLCWRG